MSRFVRQSKVRHVYADEPKPEDTFQNIKLSSATGDHNYIKGSALYMGFNIASGGGSLAVFPIDQKGKAGPQPPCLDGHKGPVLDFDFNPHHDAIVASGGDDGHVMIWGIPKGGLTETNSTPLVDCLGHQKKVTVVRYHPSAEHVLASGSQDNVCKLWDSETGEEKVSIDNGSMVNDINWNYDGSILMTSTKDKLLRLIDPRAGSTSSEVEAHDGTKTMKIENLGKEQGGKRRLATVGFTKQSKRQIKLWDYAKLDAPLATLDIDQGAGVMMPFFDEDTNLLYVAGKGDGNIRFYEIVEDDPWLFYIGEFKSKTPARGAAMLPKRVVNTSSCEVTRILKLTQNSVDTLSFIVPRKSELFQEDLFPDCRSATAALSAADFFGGKNANPKLMSLDPKKRTDNAGGGEITIKKAKTVGELTKELDAANKRIKELEDLLKKNNISF